MDLHFLFFDFAPVIHHPITMQPKHGHGISYDPRLEKKGKPFVVRLRDLNERFVVIGYYSTVDEAKTSADRALIKRFLMHGTRARKLNHEDMRESYIREIKHELLSMNPTPRCKRPLWFLFNEDEVEETQAVTEESQDVVNEMVLTEEDIDTLFTTIDIGDVISTIVA